MGRRRKDTTYQDPKTNTQRNKPWDPKPPMDVTVESMFDECENKHMKYRTEECRVCRASSAMG